MSLIVNYSKIALSLLSGVGVYAIWFLANTNGTIDHMVHIRDAGPRLLPGTKEPLKTTYTGISSIDYQLTVLDLFFWELVDGSRPDASLFCYHFAGQIFSAWALLVIESMRNANLWRIISFTAIWGVAIQNLAFAVIIPIYCILHLSTSPTVFSTIATDYAMDAFDVLSIPISITLGFTIPTILISLPAPSMLDFSTKQNLMAIWQFFPLWVSLLQPVVSFLICSFSNGKSTARDPVPNPNASLKALRPLYILLMVVSGASQISAMSVVALPTFFPSMFAPDSVGVMNFSKVFLPQGIMNSTKMSSIIEGALMLLQYDEYIGSSSMMLWATVLLVQAHYNHNKSPNWASLVFYGFNAILLTGPLGYAVVCIWARDELLQERNRDEKPKAH